ncbi:MAG TPA: glycosyltransferase family 4 protein [Rhodocyclaceae bacterium]
MTTVLHLTPHLGGGVGKAVSTLVRQTRAAGTAVRHVVACIETPEKERFVASIREAGAEVVITPTPERLTELLTAADVVQLEWWNHPATIACLCGLPAIPMRLLVWCHVSGLYNPIIPAGLIEAADRFVFTSPCSFESPRISALAARLPGRLAAISSGGGFEAFPDPGCDADDALAVGYVGSLNFAKLHPRFVDFLAAVRRPAFRVRVVGDLLNREMLERQCAAAGIAGALDFRGYTSDVAAELRSVNVLAYLLNPRHYGTAENALIEAMAMGIVPVVLDNPAERHIVEHGVTGLIVRSPAEFAGAIDRLAREPAERRRMGMAAAASVRRRFSAERMEEAFAEQYGALLATPKHGLAFQTIFGTTADAWFLSCQEHPEYFRRGGTLRLPDADAPPYDLLESTKGSAIHFHSHFPENENLAGWAAGLKDVQDVLAAPLSLRAPAAAASCRSI